jgi:hypothetical protein
VLLRHACQLLHPDVLWPCLDDVQALAEAGQQLGILRRVPAPRIRNALKLFEAGAVKVAQDEQERAVLPMVEELLNLLVRRN